VADRRARSVPRGRGLPPNANSTARTSRRAWHRRRANHAADQPAQRVSNKRPLIIASQLVCRGSRRHAADCGQACDAASLVLTECNHLTGRSISFTGGGASTRSLNTAPCHGAVVEKLIIMVQYTSAPSAAARRRRR
jgi:hypothetical protein